MEFVVEVLFEFFLDVFVAFAATIVDDNKQLTKRQKVWLRGLSVTVTVAMVGCLVFGILILCEDGYCVLGVVLTAVGGGLLLLELIIGGVTLWRQKRRRRQQGNKTVTPDQATTAQ